MTLVIDSSMKAYREKAVWLNYGWFADQVNSLKEVLKLEQNFQKNKVVTGKSPLKTFKLSSDSLIKTCRSLKRTAILNL